MKRIKSNLLFLSSSILCAMTAVSCINEDYDLNKEMDLEVTVLPGKTVPIGNFKPILLKDLIAGEENSLMKEDPEGNLYIYFAGEKIQQNIPIPAVEVQHPVQSSLTRIQVGTFVLPDLPSTPVPEQVFPSYAGFQVPVSQTSYKFSGTKTDLPKEIVALKSAQAITQLHFNLTFSDMPIRKIYICSNSEIILPECLVLDHIPESFTKDPDKNILYFKNDTEVASGATGLLMDLKIKGIDFTKMKAGQGLVEPGKFFVDEQIDLNFRVYAKSGDIITGGTVSPLINISVSADNLIFSSLEAKVKPEIATEFPPFKLEGLPPFINSNTILDLKGLRLNADFINTTPLGGTFSASAVPVFNGLPAEGVTIPPQIIPAAAENGQTKLSYSFSEKGQGAPEGYKDIAVPGLDKLLKQVPDELRIQNADIEMADEFARIILGKDYLFEVSYSINAPLNFGEDLDMSLEQNIDMNLDLTGMNVKNAILRVKALNALPLNFTIVPTVLNAADEPDSNVKIDCTSVLSSGSISSPSENDIEINISSETPLVLSNLQLSFQAKGTKGIEAQLNANQYLKLENLRLTLPDGFTTDLGGSSDVQPTI